ncbi:hypothetical protein KAI87_13110, partial [Myxococcota bacterium]|nr:hypothetical protein [Myxococcota bacterium]
MRAKRAKKNRYDSAGKLKPSKLAKIKLRVPKGKHELVIQLPKNRSGCVAFKGLKLMAKPEPKLADAPELPTPEPEPEPEPEPAPELAVVAVAPEPKLALNLPAADAELDLVAAPASEASEDSAIHEIRAQSIEEPPIEVEEEAVPSTEGSTSKVATMGLGLELGMVIPRGALNLAPTVALRFEMDLTSIVPGSIDVAGLPTELGAFASAGWVHLAYQDNETMVPGRGTGQLIQNSMVFPLDLGVSVRVFPVADIGVVAALGFAGDISRTQIDAFSLETESQNDFSVGYSLSVGATLKVPTGQIFVQLRQREIGADLDTWQNVAEPQMASTGFSLGYVFS